LGDNVTSIGKSAFQECESLESIALPNSVTNIGNNIFENCVSLSSCTIGGGITAISKNAFAYCSSLEGIKIPRGVKTLGTSAFYSCGAIEEIKIPDSVTTIGNSVFYNCTNLKTIRCQCVSAQKVYSSTFKNVKEGGTLYVPIISSGYDEWMKTSNYYLGKYNWTMVRESPYEPNESGVIAEP
jgi:hypothetical protein